MGRRCPRSVSRAARTTDTWQSTERDGPRCALFPCEAKRRERHLRNAMPKGKGRCTASLAASFTHRHCHDLRQRRGALRLGCKFQGQGRDPGEAADPNVSWLISTLQYAGHMRHCCAGMLTGKVGSWFVHDHSEQLSALAVWSSQLGRLADLPRVPALDEALRSGVPLRPKSCWKRHGHRLG